MRLAVIAVVLVAVLTVALGLWRATMASGRGTRSVSGDAGELADLALRCRAVVANLDYVCTLPSPGSPLADPVADLAGELRANVLQVEKATIQLGRHPVSDELRDSEVARLGRILDTAETASTELAALTVHGLSDPQEPMERVRDRVTALHAALEDIRRPHLEPTEPGPDPATEPGPEPGPGYGREREPEMPEAGGEPEEDGGVA